MPMQGSKFSFVGQSIYIGLDVHKKSWSVSILTQSGYKERFTQASKASVLYAHLLKHYKGGIYYSVYESGFTGFSTHYLLTELGINNIIVNASDVPSSQKEKLQKNDNVDALKLSVSLKNGMLNGIYILTPDELRFREAVRYRQIVVKENTRWKNRIKSYLFRHGIEYPPEFGTRSTHWSGLFIKWLKELSQSTMELCQYVESYISIRHTLLQANKRLREIAKEEKYAFWIELLMSIPGVGFIIAITFLSEIGNVARFKNERDFASFIGIVPTSHNSGEKSISGGMTFRGNKHLASMLIEASWIAL